MSALYLAGMRSDPSSRYFSAFLSSPSAARTFSFSRNFRAPIPAITVPDRNPETIAKKRSHRAGLSVSGSRGGSEKPFKA